MGKILQFDRNIGERKKKYEYEKIMKDWKKSQYSAIVNGHPFSCGMSPLEESEKINHIDAKLFSELDKADQDKCKKWVKQLKKTKSSVLHITSYGLKHMLEKDTGVYMTNNQFKDLMLECGFEPVKETDLNWHYHIDRRSVTAISKKQETDRLMKQWKSVLP